MGLFNRGSENRQEMIFEGIENPKTVINCTLDNYLEIRAWRLFCMANSMLARRTEVWEKIDDEYYKVILRDDLEGFRSSNYCNVIFFDAFENSVNYPSDFTCQFNTERLWCREFSRRLIRAMNYRGIDQIHLSELTGISQASISGYARGVRPPSAYSISLIAKALGCSLDYLQRF